MDEMDNSKAYSIEQAKQQATAMGEASIIEALYTIKQQKAMMEEQADQMEQEAGGIPVEDPEGLAETIAQVVVHSQPDIQQYMMQQLQPMPTLLAMVEQHIAAIYDPAAQGEGSWDGMEGEEQGGSMEGGFGGGPAAEFGGGPAVGPGGPPNGGGSSTVTAPMPERRPPTRTVGGV